MPWLFEMNQKLNIPFDQMGQYCYQLAEKLWPINRSLTGDGVRQTLAILKSEIPELQVSEVPSGTSVFDWTIPQEWKIRQAYIEDESGHRWIDFANHNLHVMGYSTPVDQWMSREELEPYLYSLPNQPTAIPYVTSYYAPRWGFCLSQQQRDALPDGRFHVVIDSELFDGHLTYAECYLPGQTEQEILLSTYICHPSMANNELSGPVVTTALIQYLKSIERRYSYRIVFVPETIGSIAYLSKHLSVMKRNTVAGLVVTCVGDPFHYSYLSTRQGNHLIDRVAKHVLLKIEPNYKYYSFLDRGSDERQYGSPLVNLPVGSIMRSKYADFLEYHSSLDNLSFVTPAGLQGGFDAIRQSLLILEKNRYPKVTVFCEPQLGKRGLYPTVSFSGSSSHVRLMTNVLAYADGSMSLFDMAELFRCDFFELDAICSKLEEEQLVISSFQSQD